MLILSRHVGETIVIGQPPDQWRVTVRDLSGDKVRVGITSPDQCVVQRLITRDTRKYILALSPDIAITIVDIRGDKVRIAVEAQKTCSVFRLETFEAIQRERGNDTGTSRM